MPNTYIKVYIPPHIIEPGSTANAKTPARTGAQQVVAMPEKIPREYTDPALCFLSCGCTENGKEKPFLVRIMMPRTVRKVPPVIKIILWYSLKNWASAEKPSPIGKKTVAIPKKNTNVIMRTLRFSRKIDPKYDGSKTEIQHGANKAAMPAIKAVINDARINILTIFTCRLTKLRDNYNLFFIRRRKNIFSVS